MLQGVMVLVPIVLSLHLVCIQIWYDMAYFFLICSLALYNHGTYICLILLCVYQNAFCIAVLFPRCSKSLWLYACPKNSIEREKRNRTILSKFHIIWFEWVSSSQHMTLIMLYGCRWITLQSNYTKFINSRE